MNTKQISALSIAVIFAISMSLGTIRTAHAQSTVLSLQPAVISGPPPAVSETFNVTLEITDVTNLWGWAVHLAWNASILEMVGSPREAPFLQPGTLFAAAPPDNVNGEIPDMACGRTSATGNSGSGVLATLTFKVRNYSYSNTTISITYSELWDPANPHNPIAHTTANLNLVTRHQADLDGNGKVNILDIVKVAIAFGSVPGDPNWNPIADLNKDNKVNILDIVIIAINFGKTF